MRHTGRTRVSVAVSPAAVEERKVSVAETDKLEGFWGGKQQLDDGTSGGAQMPPFVVGRAAAAAAETSRQSQSKTLPPISIHPTSHPGRVFRFTVVVGPFWSLYHHHRHQAISWDNNERTVSRAEGLMAVISITRVNLLSSLCIFVSLAAAFVYRVCVCLSL